MKIEARVRQLLADVPVEERFRARTIKDAAAFLGVSVGTVYRLIVAGKLGSVKLGAAVRVRLLDLVALQVQNERTSAPKTTSPHIDDDETAARLLLDHGEVS